MHTFNPSIGRQKQADLCLVFTEFQVSQGDSDSVRVIAEDAPNPELDP